MISPMPHRRRLAAMIWAAIFVIAAQFLAGSALAHAGHSHGNSTASSAAQLTDLGKASIGQTARLEQADLSLITQDDTDMPVIPQPGRCTGGCCGNGIGCCGAVLAAASNSVPDDRPQQETVSLATDSHSGVDPEALARPPRTLA